jgi:hypothetical protein
MRYVQHPRTPICTKKQKENFGEVVAVVKLIPEQQEEQLRPLGLANEAKNCSKSQNLFHSLFDVLSFVCLQPTRV